MPRLGEFGKGQSYQGMEVTFGPDLQVRIDEMAPISGRAVGDILRDAVAAYVEGVCDTRALLDGRFDEIKSGRVALIDGETGFAQLHERIEARRKGEVLGDGGLPGGSAEAAHVLKMVIARYQGEIPTRGDRRNPNVIFGNRCPLELKDILDRAIVPGD